MGALVIGASTGGPQALHEVLKAAKPALGAVPTLICQHMPAGFTTVLADHLSTGLGLRAREAKDGEPIVAGDVYLAPGGRHFTVQRVGGRIVARLADGPPVNFCRPSVDPLFRSAVEVYGAGVVAVVLTGMGSDGAAAVTEVASAGGRVIAQDEATSAVWGMPGAAVATGACSAVLPLSGIGIRIAAWARGERT
ncbi:CheB methylesterase domain-containing protein [Methylopila sp. M107]|uniref:CheB methylesterase domain-containing protein n=1 Tax=Methylopila sp. M107 TaxID=1101190 RepID=UPI0003793D89|nr:CheB methylesterase domain-containing protein [Methylopila sp. M107]